jgi:uncharacterized protein YkwD
MLFYVLALGGTLFTVVGAGITILEISSPGVLPGKNVTTITTSESALAAATPAESAPPPASPSMITSPTPDRITSMEDMVTALVNKERAGKCTNSLRTDERLRKAARDHSADMAKKDYFSHVSRDGSSFVDRIARAGYPKSSAASENIALGYSSAKAVVAGWMNSEGHRNNIMNCSSKAVGVGLAYRGDKPYWTQDFGRS